MRNIIFVDRFGYFIKTKINTKDIVARYYVGHTINGVPKYRWNFWMWSKTILNKS